MSEKGSKHYALKDALTKAGGAVGLARALGITSQAVSQWVRPPADRVLEIERITGISRHELRADIYGEDTP
jgi:DNA-binding transcriptional regulator YdaS (Cro superfamily)